MCFQIRCWIYRDVLESVREGMAYHTGDFSGLSILRGASRCIVCIVQEDRPNVGLDSVGSIGRITIR